MKTRLQTAIVLAAVAAFGFLLPPALAQTPPAPETTFTNGANTAWTTAGNWDNGVPVATGGSPDDALIADGLTVYFDQSGAGEPVFGTLTLGVGSTFQLKAGANEGIPSGYDVYFSNGAILEYTAGSLNRDPDLYVLPGAAGKWITAGSTFFRGTLQGAGDFTVVMKGDVESRIETASTINFTGALTYESFGGAARQVTRFGRYGGTTQAGSGTTTFSNAVRLVQETADRMHNSATIKLSGGTGGSANPKWSIQQETIGNLLVDSPGTLTGTSPLLRGTSQLTVTGTVTFLGTAGTVEIDDSNTPPVDNTLVASNLTFTGSGSWEVRGDGAIALTGGTISNDLAATINNPLSGNFTKTGSATLTLGALSGSGSNMVSQGTLSFTNSSSISPYGTLSVDSAAILNLNYVGTGSVLYLNLGGTPAAPGVWGADGSGADNTSTLITGTGCVNHRSGTVANTFYWDGGNTNIAGNGNLASAGGSGTWNTTTQNWDIGFAPHVAWGNTTNDKAIFGGSADYTVTIAETLNVGDMTFTITGDEIEYTINGATLNFGPGATISVSDNRAWQTITCPITGSPDVETKDWGAGNQYQGIRFAPSSGTVTLGDVLNPNNSGNTDKAGFAMAGSTTGNKVGNISYASGDKYGIVYFESGGWTATNGIRTGYITATSGTHLLGGTVQCDYNELRISGTCKIMGSFTNYTSNRGSSPFVFNGGTIAPGNGVGTITMDWPDGSTTPVPCTHTSVNSPNGDHSFTLMNGSTYEWEVGPDATDTIHMMQGGLYVSNMTLKVIDAGGTPKVSDQLPVFTYNPAGSNMTTPDTATLNANVTIDISGTTFTVGTPTLVNDGAGTIYLTGMGKAGVTLFMFW